jgi:hypothetical protein
MRARLIEILEVQSDHAAFQLLQALRRIKPGTDPVADIRASAKQRAAALHRSEHRFRIPVKIEG